MQQGRVRAYTSRRCGGGGALRYTRPLLLKLKPGTDGAKEAGYWQTQKKFVFGKMLKVNPIGIQEDIHWPMDRWFRYIHMTSSLIRFFAGIRFRQNWRASAWLHQFRHPFVSYGDRRQTPTSSDTFLWMKQEPPPLMQLRPAGWQTADMFRVSTDQLLGGHSEAFLDETEEDTMLFHGTLRITRDPQRMYMFQSEEPITEEHCGYATISFDWPRLYRPCLFAFRAFEVRCRGSQHPFFLRIEQNLQGTMSSGFGAMHLFVPTEEWRSYILRFESFRGVFAGEELGGWTGGGREGHAMWHGIKKIGFGINHAEENDFWLEIDYVKLVSHSKEECSMGDDNHDFKGYDVYTNEHDKYG